MSDSELARLVAYAFHATGRRRLLEEDIVNLVARERHWMAPSKVRALVASARSQGCLRAAGAHAYELAQELSDLVLPVDYRPSESGLDAALAQAPGAAPSVSLFRRIVKTISDATKESEASVVAAVNQVQEDSGRLLRAEVAALVVGGVRGVDLRAFYAETESELQPHPQPAGAR